MGILLITAGTCACEAFELLLRKTTGDESVIVSSVRDRSLPRQLRLVPTVAVTAGALSGATGVVRECLEGMEKPPAILLMVPQGPLPDGIVEWVKPGWAILWDSSPSDLLGHALQAIAQGDGFLDPAIGAVLVPALTHETEEAALKRIDPEHVLPPRLRKVAVLTARGLAADTTAKRLHLSVHTVRDYRRETYASLHVDGRQALIHRYQDEPSRHNGRR